MLNYPDSQELFIIALTLDLPRTDYQDLLCVGSILTIKQSKSA